MRPVKSDNTLANGECFFDQPETHVSFLVEYKVEAFYRAASFRALIGDAILRFQRDSTTKRRRDVQLLLAVLLERMSRKTSDDLKEYAGKYEPDLNWLVLSEGGEGVFRLLGREEPVRLSEPLRTRMEATAAGNPIGIFSPRNQWLLKLLLMPGIDHRYWGGPDSKPHSVGELAEVSGVSQPSVSQFVQRAESAGFLRRSENDFIMLQHRELLEDWSHALKHRPLNSVGVRPIYGDEPEQKWLARVRQYCAKSPNQHPVAVGSHLACHLHGVGRSNNRSMILHVNRPLPELMDKLQLVEDSSPAPWLKLVFPFFADTVFRSSVVLDGVPVVDLLQCYLDVRTSPARGLEQADHIFQKVLSRHFEVA